MLAAKHGSPVLYSCITAGRDRLRPWFCRTPGPFRSVLFSDEPQRLRLEPAACFWDEIRPLAWNLPDPVRTARAHKHRPFELFPDAPVSIWLDATHVPIVEMQALFDYLDDRHPLACFRHEWRDTALAEGRECQRLGLDDPQVIEQQLARYAAEGFPDRCGLYDTACLVRRHLPAVRGLQELWWQEIVAGSRRDQISFPYVLHRSGMTPAVLPGEGRSPLADFLQPHRPNPFFEVVIHR
jgi:hypothetical protein